MDFDYSDLCSLSRFQPLDRDKTVACGDVNHAQNAILQGHTHPRSQAQRFCRSADLSPVASKIHFKVSQAPFGDRLAGAEHTGAQGSTVEVIDRANASFWDEPCGTTRLEHLGFSATAQSDRAAQLAFDAFFWEFYPYLDKHIPFAKMAGKRVLEVGLGMGTMSERIARSGGLLTGLDIAEGPVQIVNDRLSQCGFARTARTGSILNAPFPDDSFDFVVSLGCLHHTGNLPRALSETHRVLRKGGSAHIMLYYAYSPKRWLLWPRATAQHMWRSRRASDLVIEATVSER